MSNSVTTPTEMISDGQGSKITWDLNDKKTDLASTENGIGLDKTMVMGHELGHAWGYDRELVESAIVPSSLKNLQVNGPSFSKKFRMLTKIYLDARRVEEIRNGHIENIVRSELGVSLREYYSDAPKYHWPLIKPGYNYQGEHNIHKENQINPR